MKCYRRTNAPSNKTAKQFITLLVPRDIGLTALAAALLCDTGPAVDCSCGCVELLLLPTVAFSDPDTPALRLPVNVDVTIPPLPEPPTLVLVDPPPRPE